MKATNILMMALCGLATTAALVSCEDKDAAAQQAAGPQMPPLKVGVMPLLQRDVDVTEVWFGHLRGVEQADIRPEVSGKLLERVYKDGAMVQKGDVLFEIDPATYQAAVNQASAALAAAKAAVLQAQAADERAKQDVTRYEPLMKSGSVSEKMFTDAQQTKLQTEAGLAAAQAQVKQAEAALELAQINLERCTIRAPFTGLASKSTVSVGDFISPAGALPLTTMSSVDPIRVDFSVPGKHMLSKVLAPGYDAKGNQSPISDFELILEDGTVFEHKGHVEAMDSEVSKTTGTVNCIGHVPNPDTKLRSGSAVRVRAKTGEIKDAVLVPVRALVSSMNHRYIYVVAPNGTPLGIDVQTGQEMMLDVADGTGKVSPMLMQVVTGTVKPIADTLKDAGIENIADAQLVVEGGKGADRYAKINFMMKQKGVPDNFPGFQKLVPAPFEYTAPVSTTPSATAKQK